MHMQSKLRCTNCEWMGQKQECARWSENSDCCECGDTEIRLGDVHIDTHKCPECGDDAVFLMLHRYDQEALRRIVAEKPEGLDAMEELEWAWRVFTQQGWDSAEELEAISNYLTETKVDRESLQGIPALVEYMWEQVLEAANFVEPEPEYDGDHYYGY